jgi:hypothetical protein
LNNASAEHRGDQRALINRIRANPEQRRRPDCPVSTRTLIRPVISNPATTM